MLADAALLLRPLDPAGRGAAAAAPRGGAGPVPPPRPAALGGRTAARRRAPSAVADRPGRHLAAIAGADNRAAPNRRMVPRAPARASPPGPTGGRAATAT